eukprot:TRINITY_DN9355_c0_g2_i2.p1 TRINITY_DN9355_c0_g2~~TRINITY_DN9355_c0_g2_i2.p1  ORF type:complete len:577 (+),score=127.24 TRINITY_DN9355_c0_g2_i2:76-1806(+)
MVVKKGGSSSSPFSSVTKALEQKKQIESTERTEVEKAQDIVNSVWFDGAIGVVIVLSAANIGLELTLDVQGQSTLGCRIFENIALLVYMAELGYRFYAYRIKAFRDDWVKFDLFLVILGVINSWIIEPITLSIDDAESVEALGPLMLLRTARLLRLAKTARLFSRVQDFWFLVRGFLNCATLIVYSFVVFFICIYMFACAGMELIAKNPLNKVDPEFQAQSDRYFSSLPKTLLTLMRFATLDNTAEVYAPLVEKDPWLAIYFVILSLVVSLILFNVLGAVIFGSAQDQTQKEADDTQKQRESSFTSLINNMKEMFLRLDEDKSGQISRDEIINIDARDLVVLREALGLTKPLQVFSALDVDNSGEISINEFFDGILDVAVQKTTVDQKRIEKQVETLHWRIKEMFNWQHEMKMQIAKFGEDLRTITGGSSRRPLQHQGSSSALSAKFQQKPQGSGQDSKESAAPRPGGSSTEFEDEDLPKWAQDLTSQLQQSFQVAANLCMKQVGAAVQAMHGDMKEFKTKEEAARRRASTQSLGEVAVGAPRKSPRDSLAVSPRPPVGTGSKRPQAADKDKEPNH